jgi:hypothetical protein
MIPRGVGEEEDRKLLYFTPNAVKRFKKQRAVSFEDELLPLIKKEFWVNYYIMLFKKQGVRLKLDVERDRLKEQIAVFHRNFPDAEKFDWEKLTQPFVDQNVLTHNTVCSYLAHVIQEAKQGMEHSPLISAVATWRRISPLFNEVYSYNGLDADSHRLVDEHYFGLFNRISYGPPVKNLEKILALAENGLVSFEHIRSPYLEELADNRGKKWYFGESQNPIHLDYLINARIPQNNSTRPNTLYTKLIENELFVPHGNTQSGHYLPGSVAINAAGHPYKTDGSIRQNISLYGTPTEGVTFDNDTLSRTRNDFASIWAQNLAATLTEKELETTYE